MVRPCPVTSFTPQTSTFSTKKQWSCYVWLHPYHNLHPRCSQKNNGPAMSCYILNTTDVLFGPKNIVARPCPFTLFTAPSSALSSKNKWSCHVRLHRYRHMRPRCPQKHIGPAMFCYILNITDIHLVPKNTMVWPCPVTFSARTTSTLSSKNEWSCHVRLHRYHHIHPRCPQQYNGPAMSGYILNITDIHFVP